MKLRGWLGTRAGQLVGGVFALAIIAGFILAILWATNALGWRRWRVNEAQAFIGAELPVGASDVQFATDNTKTRIVWLRFTLSAEADLDAFVQAMGLDAALRDGFTPFPAPNPAEAALPWWTPGAAQVYSGLHAIHAEKVYELLLDQTDAANAIVYMRVYSIGM